MKNIVSFSGGKDSTAMLLMMIERNIKIDEIIFCDTGVEFYEMYEHIEQVEKYINRKITVLKSDKTFKYLLLEHQKKSGKNKDLGYGFPRMVNNRWCTSKLKTDVFNRYMKKYKDDEVNLYLGIAYDEQHRKKDKLYPLIDWQITERQALEYCYQKGFDWGGLYKIFKRVSCWCCPNQGLKELKNLYKYYPNKWQQLKKWESQSYNNFRCDYTLEQLEKRFKSIVDLENRQLSLFSEEEL